jgi:hypothetical protein
MRVAEDGTLGIDGFRRILRDGDFETGYKATRQRKKARDVSINVADMRGVYHNVNANAAIGGVRRARDLHRRREGLVVANGAAGSSTRRWFTAAILQTSRNTVIDAFEHCSFGWNSSLSWIQSAPKLAMNAS